MKQIPRELLALAATRHGLLTAAELNAYGFVGRSRLAAFDSGQLTPIHRGVYKLPSHPDSFEQRCLAVCLATGEDVALSGPTGGRLMGLRKMFGDEIHVLARHAIRLDRVTAHRTDLLMPSDIGRVGEFRVLRPPRLFCDLASHLDEATLESVLEQMIDRRLLSAQAARGAAKRFVAPGRPGSLRLGRVLDGRSDWLKPADSDLEIKLWRALSRRGLRLDRQVEVRVDDGSMVHIDLADPARRFGIEVDHVTWHGGRLDAQRDKRRDRQLTQLGWTISRVTDDDIQSRLDETVDQLLSIAQRCTNRV